LRKQIIDENIHFSKEKSKFRKSLFTIANFYLKLNYKETVTAELIVAFINLSCVCNFFEKAFDSLIALETKMFKDIPSSQKNIMLPGLDEKW